MAFIVVNPEKFRHYPDKCRKNFDPEKFSNVALRLGFDAFTDDRKQALLWVSKENSKVINQNDYYDGCNVEDLKGELSDYQGTIELKWQSADQQSIRYGKSWIKRNNGKSYPVDCRADTAKAYEKHCIPEPKILKFLRCKKNAYSPALDSTIALWDTHGVDVLYNAGLFHNRTIALSEYDRMDVLAFDIDCHDGDEIHTERTLYYLLLELGFPEVMFAEKSVQGGYHLFIQIDDVVPDVFKRQFIQYFQKKYASERFTIEMRMRTKPFRLPDSPSYMPCKLVIKGEEYIDAIPYNSRTEWYDNVLAFNNPISTKRLEDFCVYEEVNQNAILSSVSPQPIEVKPKPIANKSLDQKSLNTLNIQSNNKKKDKLLHRLFHDYPIYAGKRVETMKSIASLCCYLKLDQDQFFQACMANNVNSKDFAIWSEDESRKVCYQFYESMTSKFQKTDNTFQYNADQDEEIFHSNIQLLEGDLPNWCEKYSDYVFNEIILPKMSSGKWMEETRRALVILVKEVIGFMIYDFHITKKYNPLSGITYDKYCQLRRGFQPTRKMLNLMKEHYEIKIDIHKLFNDLMNSGMFVQIKSSDRGWSYGKHSYSRQWRLAVSMEDHNMIYGLSIYESIMLNIRRIIENIDLSSVTSKQTIQSA